jgi:bacteriocin-like protein
MRELNEQELNQVAGGNGFSFNYGTQAQAGGDVSAKHGVVYTSSVTDSSLNHYGSNSFAANKSFAAGYKVAADSSAASTSGLTISAS